MNITFPQSMVGLQTAKSPEELRNLIQEQLCHHGLAGIIKYRFCLKWKKYLYVACRSCRVKISYRQNEEGYFILSRFENRHNHSVLSKPGLFKDQIIQYITNLPEMIRQKDICRLVKQKYNISKSSCYRLYNQATKSQINYAELTQYIYHSKSYHFFVKQEHSPLPSALLIITQKMKQKFQQFGDFICFDLTYNLIRQQFEGRQYSIGVIIGLSNCFSILPFGLVILENQTVEIFYQIFSNFFQYMVKKPKIIITDQQKSIISSIKMLKEDKLWDGDHLFDWYHLLKNVKRNLKEKEKLEIFKQILKAQNQSIFKKTIQIKINDFCPQDKVIFQEFLERYEQFSFCNLKPNFVGFSVSTSPCQKMNDMIKQQFPNSKKYCYVVKKLLVYLEILAKNSYRNLQVQKSKVQYYFPLIELRSLRQAYCKQLFNKILYELTSTILCRIYEEEDERIIVIDEHGFEFNLSYDNTQGLWKCSCQFREKSGILCRHIAKVTIMRDQKISPYIYERWRIQKEFLEKEMIKINRLRIRRPRKSRRNRL